LESRTSEDSPIRVDCVPEGALGLPEGSGTLGMTFAPGMKDIGWNREVATDLAALRDEYGTDILVSLMEDFEYNVYHMNGERSFFESATAAGMEVVRFPIVDVDVPREEQAEEFADLVGGIIGSLRDGKKVVAHCRGGIGRTGTVAASVLVGLGHDADNAIEIVRRARSPRMVETWPQEEYVREFAEKYRGRWG